MTEHTSQGEIRHDLQLKAFLLCHALPRFLLTSSQRLAHATAFTPPWGP